MNPPFDIQSWHFCYRDASKEDVQLNMLREGMWFEFLRYMRDNRPDFTQNDLRAIIALRRRRKLDRAHDYQSVKFDKLIGCPDQVEQDIAEARGRRRIEPPSPRQRVLMDAGMAKEPPSKCKPVGDVIAAAKALEDLRKWRQETGI